MAAQAQYRLVQALLQKGDVANAAREFEKLARLIGRLANEGRKKTPVTLSFAPAASLEGGARVVVRGKVAQVTFVNPTSWLTVDTADGSRYTFALASPNSMLGMGINRTSLKPGDEATVTGVLAVDGSRGESGSRTARADRITLADGNTLFDRARLPPFQTAWK